MKSQVSKLFAGLVALLCSAASLAASVTITASTLTPNVGDNFTMTVTGDVGNTFAATMALSFDATKVAYVTGATLSPWNVFTRNPAGGPFPNPGVFDVETPTATAANPGVYNVAVLTFQALAAGAANIVINDDGGNVSGWFDADTADYIPVTYTQASVTVTSNGPAIVVTDSVAPMNDLQVPFGQVTEGSTSATQTVTVTNGGNQNLELGVVASANPLAGPFTIVSDSCSGMTVTPASSCVVGLEFSPVAIGAVQDSFDIPSNDPVTASVTVQVSGTGQGLPAPDIAVTDSVAPTTDQLVPFGSVVVNQTATQTITVTNAGTANLTLGQVAMANPLVAPFNTLSDGCSNQVLAPSDSCTVQVQFQPTAVGGPFSDSLDIPSDDPDTATVTVSVTGTGAPVPVPNIVVTDSVSPAADLIVDFGDVSLPDAPTQTVTVTNGGTASLVIGTVAGANPLAAPFSITANTCSGQTLAPAATCTITVRFAPEAIQPYNEAFDIPSNDPDDAIVTITLAGSGMPAASLPDIVVTDSVSPAGDRVVDFGDVTAPNLATQTVTVTNAGSGSLVIGTVAAANPLAAPFSITADNCSGQTLAPAAACTITVRFAPDAIQAYNDNFDIPSNDPDQATVTITVGGRGIARSLSGGSATDPATLLVLGLAGLLAGRRRWLTSVD
ncbi:MAG: choice-of-anchor D domain-containing protein [Gammaproteobacteria bacterium]